MFYTVLCYIILLASQGVIDDDTYDNLDFSFTIVFTIEIFLKFVAYGLKGGVLKFSLNFRNLINILIILINGKAFSWIKSIESIFSLFFSVMFRL